MFLTWSRHISQLGFATVSGFCQVVSARVVARREKTNSFQCPAAPLRAQSAAGSLRLFAAGTTMPAAAGIQAGHSGAPSERRKASTVTTELTKASSF
jgi:hypothetical protein